MSAASLTAADLAGLPLFAGADVDDLATLADVAERRTLAEGETLFRRGDPAATVYWIESGQLALRVDHHGRSTLVMIERAGDLLGWSALQEHATSLTTARAMTPVQLVAFPAECLLDLLAAGTRSSRVVVQRLFGFAAAHLDGTRDQLLGLGSEGVISAG